MTTKEKIIKLRKQFEEETGKGTEIPSFINEPITFTKMYVEWLEKKIVNNLKHQHKTTKP